MQKHYDRVGLLSLLGRTYGHLLPTIVGAPIGELCANHPPLLHWLVRPFVALFGLHEWTLRVGPILASAATAALLVEFARGVCGRVAAAATGLLFATLPMEFLYGRMPSFEAPLLFFGALAFRLAPSRPGRRGFLGCAACVAAATFIDWIGAFLAPALLLHERIATRGPVSPRWGALVVGAAFASTLAFVGLVVLWTGSLANTIARFAWAAESAVTEPVFSGQRDWLVRIGRHFVETWSPAGIAAALAAVAWMLVPAARVARPVIAFVVAWLCVGATNIVAFPARSYVHDFFCFYTIPALVVAVASALQAVAERRGTGLAFCLLGVIVAGQCWTSVRRYGEVDRAWSREAKEFVGSLYDEETSLVVLAGDAPWTRSVYLRPWTLSVGTDFNRALEVIDRFTRGELGTRKLAFLCSVGEPNALVRSISADQRASLVSRALVERQIAVGGDLRSFEVSR